MTEAYRPTQGEILTTPVDLAGVKNVTNTAPKASRNDLSHDMMAGPSFRDRALAVALALSTLGGAKVILDSQTAKGQSPSPAPSIGASFEPGTSPVTTDPITGLPCVPGNPNASPEPSKAPLPSLPPDIGMVPGGEVELFAFTNAGGDSVKVTVGAQSEPSLAPSVAPEASPEATDPETAGDIECAPLSDEQIQANYSMQAVFDRPYSPLSETQYMEIINGIAPDIAEVNRNIEELDTPEEVIADYQRLVNDIQALPGERDGAVQELVSSIDAQVNYAQAYARNRSSRIRRLGNSLMIGAFAVKGILDKYADFRTDKGKKIKNGAARDKEADKIIEDLTF